MTPRMCYHCDESVPHDHDYYFDDEFNMCHSECDSIMVAVTDEAAKKLEELVKNSKARCKGYLRPYSTGVAYGYNYSHNQNPSYYQGQRQSIP